MSADVCAADLLVFDSVLDAAMWMCRQYARERCASHWDVYEHNHPFEAYLMPAWLFDPGLCAQAHGPLCFVGVHGEHSQV